MGEHPRGLLDTSVLIDFPAADVARAVTAVAVSTISLAELAYGLHGVDRVTSVARRRRYQWVVDRFDVLDFDAASADAYGALAADVRRAGRDPRPRRFDLLIAAVALRHGLPLVTRNPRDLAGLHRSVTVIGV